MASTPEAVKEMLVQRSADYAGRQQTYFFEKATLGRLLVKHFKMRLLPKESLTCFFLIGGVEWGMETVFPLLNVLMVYFS